MFSVVGARAGWHTGRERERERHKNTDRPTAKLHRQDQKGGTFLRDKKKMMDRKIISTSHPQAADKGQLL